MSESVSKICTAAEIAAEFKTTSKTVLEWYHAGKIPAVTAEGSLYRFDLEEVREALKKRAKPKAKPVGGVRRPMDRTRGGSR